MLLNLKENINFYLCSVGSITTLTLSYMELIEPFLRVSGLSLSLVYTAYCLYLNYKKEKHDKKRIK